MKTTEKKDIFSIKSSLANIITFGNLSLGCFAILSLLDNKFFNAAIYILFGAMFDRADGMIARKLETTSHFGKELDSLCDLVTFGVAPSMLIWQLKLNALPIYGSIISVFFVISGAYRLARFNCSSNNDIFIGVPITLAGGILTLYSLIVIRYDVNTYFTALVVIALSFCMVSKRITIKKM